MGAELKDEPKNPVFEREETPKVFGDPASYEHLPMEERKAMTERMKKNFLSLDALRRWSQEKKDGR